MGKNPAFQFYIKDWLSDPQLKMASFSTKGMWIYLLCSMWECPERGKISGTKTQIAKILGATREELDLFLDEAKILQFCDVTNCNGECNENVTVINRRMYREWKEKENTRLRVEKFRSKDLCNDDVTEMYSRARAGVGDSSNINIKDKYLECVFLTKDQFQKLVSKNGQQLTDKAIFILNNYIMSKEKDPYKSHYHTLLGWPLERVREVKDGGQRSRDGAGRPGVREYFDDTPPQTDADRETGKRILAEIKRKLEKDQIKGGQDGV